MINSKTDHVVVVVVPTDFILLIKPWKILYVLGTFLVLSLINYMIYMIPCGHEYYAKLCATTSVDISTHTCREIDIIYTL